MEIGLTFVSPIILFNFFVLLAVWWHKHRQHRNVIPARFNRQRREVCFVPEGHTEPIFVPWESLSAWVIETYGVHREYGMGVGFHHTESGQDFTLEFPCGGLPLAIANWEALRGYMEYQVHSLKQIQDPLDLQGPDDPPHEGLHTFHNARERMRRRYRAGEVGRLYVFSWYLYHLMTLWTLPFRLTDWENRKIKHMRRHDIPQAMHEWSKPLPPEQWAKPSAELQRQSQRTEQLRQQYPQRSVFEIFDYVRCGAKRSPSRARARVPNDGSLSG
nr:hypothetical protein [Pseudomonas typographi]